MDNVNSDWAQTVLTFWFDELTKKEWFIANQKLDNTIINRFQPTHKWQP